MLLMQNKWFVFVAAIMLTAGGGLVLGKFKERDYLGALYERRDFTLLDDKGDFFRLNSLPEKTLALLVFTPDGIPVNSVKPMFAFTRHLNELRQHGIEPMLVSRTNREIAKNFKHASRFDARLLVDIGGFVGRNSGVWESAAPVAYWGYALVDRNFRVYWKGAAGEPLPFEQLRAELNGVRPLL